MQKSFGACLATLRGTISQRETAAIFGVKQQTYSSWERDEKEPCLDQVKKLSLHYGVTSDYLLGIPSSSITATNSAVAMNNSTAHNAVTTADVQHLAETVQSQQQTISRLAGIIENLTASGGSK